MQFNFDHILDRLKGERQMIYVIGLVIGIFVVVFIIYQIFFTGSAQQRPVEEKDGSSLIPSVTFVDQLKRDLGILADPVFKNLKLPIELPIRITPPGRDNPFSPF
jgi:hypothetical protein